MRYLLAFNTKGQRDLRLLARVRPSQVDEVLRDKEYFRTLYEKVYQVRRVM